MCNVFCIDEVMVSNSRISYSQIEAAASVEGVETHPSEAHGMVVGALSNHLKSGQKPNLITLLLADKQHNHAQAFDVLLHELYRESADVLLEGGENFKLLLVDENEALDFRTESLAAWCRGYMLGLLYNDAFSIDQLAENGAEIARDIMAIAEAEAGADDDTEEDWALVELEEYVKVGVQLIFEFIYSERATETPDMMQ